MIGCFDNLAPHEKRKRKSNFVSSNASAIRSFKTSVRSGSLTLDPDAGRSDRFYFAREGIMKVTSTEDDVLGRSLKPNGGYGWIVCCGTFIVNFVVFGIHNSFGVVYVSLLDDLKLGEMETGELYMLSID